MICKQEKRMLKIIIAALIVFAISQQLLILGYGTMSDELSDSLARCIGIKE